MNSVPFDPDIKINMSLDEIILLTRGQLNYHLQGRYSRTLKRKKINLKRRMDVNTSEHSVPLLSSTEGVDIYVSKKSPLLSAENRRRITQAVSNRVLNSTLLEKSKEIIPAQYKLIKTGHGVERVLVPAIDYSLKTRQRKLSPPRKLNKKKKNNDDDDNDNNNKSNNNNNDNDNTNANLLKSPQDEPPPLIVAPIYTPQKQSVQETPMEVDNPDDEIVILNSPDSKKMWEVIDVESDVPEYILNAKKIYVRALPSVTKTSMKTLNDRFTMLSGNFNFN